MAKYQEREYEWSIGDHTVDRHDDLGGYECTVACCASEESRQAALRLLRTEPRQKPAPIKLGELMGYLSHYYISAEDRRLHGGADGGADVCIGTGRATRVVHVPFEEAAAVAFIADGVPLSTHVRVTFELVPE